MKKATILGLLALVVAGMLFSTTIISAYRGDFTAKDPNQERHELMEKAFDNLDYDAWYNLMTENGRHPRVVDVITESNFKTFAQAHNAAENGDYDSAASIRAELGLNNGPHDGTGHRNWQRINHGKGMQYRDEGNCEGRGRR